MVLKFKAVFAVPVDNEWIIRIGSKKGTIIQYGKL